MLSIQKPKVPWIRALFLHHESISICVFDDSCFWIAWSMLLSLPDSRKLDPLCVCYEWFVWLDHQRGRQAPVPSFRAASVRVILLWVVLYIECCLLLIKRSIAMKFENHCCCCRDLPTPSVPFIILSLLTKDLFYSACVSICLTFHPP